MADYLSPSDTDLTIKEKKWIFQCRVDDIDVKANRKWQNDQTQCLSCNSKSEETQMHILACQALIGNCEIVTYLPNYHELFGNNLDELAYVARVLEDNHSRRIVE